LLTDVADIGHWMGSQKTFGAMHPATLQALAYAYISHAEAGKLQEACEFSVQLLKVLHESNHLRWPY
jgi:hypothetical protein